MVAGNVFPLTVCLAFLVWLYSRMKYIEGYGTSEGDADKRYSKTHSVWRFLENDAHSPLLDLRRGWKACCDVSQLAVCTYMYRMSSSCSNQEGAE